jgi:membrane protein required for colicin V production
MNVADLFVIGIVVFSAVVALFRGFIREVLSVLAWAGAVMVTLWGFSFVQPYAQAIIGQPMLANIAAGLALFLISLVIFSLITHAIANLVRNSALSALDRSLGLIFGVVRGVVLAALAYLALGWVVPANEQPPWLREARVRPLVENVADVLRRLAPPEFRGQVKSAKPIIDERIQQGQELERALRALSNPQVNQPAQAGETGYKPEDRRDLERLLQNQSTQLPREGGPTR